MRLGLQLELRITSQREKELEALNLDGSMQYWKT